MLTQLAYVALGGAVGSVLRALIGMAVAFPLGTLTVNVLGSFAIGLAWAAGVGKTPNLHPFLMLGVLGGFTTFSTFSLDVLHLIQDAQHGSAAAYVLASVILSIAACAFAIWLWGRVA